MRASGRQNIARNFSRNISYDGTRPFRARTFGATFVKVFKSLVVSMLVLAGLWVCYAATPAENLERLSRASISHVR